MIRVLTVNADINSDSALSENLVPLREGLDTFISTHHSLQVTAAAAQHYYKIWSSNYFLNLFYASPKSCHSSFTSLKVPCHVLRGVGLYLVGGGIQGMTAIGIHHYSHCCHPLLLLPL